MSTAASLPETERPVNAAERVLIVEDDNAARSGLTELVRPCGFLTESEADGEQWQGDEDREHTEQRSADAAGQNRACLRKLPAGHTGEEQAR